MAKKKSTKKSAKKVKKAKKSTKSAKSTAKKSARKKVAKSAKRSTKKVKKTKKTAKKATRKATAPKRAKKSAAKTAKTTQRAAKAPKRPRRTRQALPPTVPAVALEAEPVMPAAPPIAATGPAPEAPPTEPHGPQPGDLAPEFSLPDGYGKTHRLSDYRGQRVVLYFYPKDDTPGCTAEACGFRDSLAAFTDRNTVVLGVSPDSPDSHDRFSQKYSLTFPLLADEDHAAAEAYGVWILKKQYGREYMGISRTTFVIDEEGHVLHVFHQVRPDGHEQEVLTRLA